MDYRYPAQTFSEARRCLMLPHPTGDANAIACAFGECANGLESFNHSCLDDDARRWVVKLLHLMDTEGLQDPGNLGLYRVKAESLTLDQKLELSSLVDELANWFVMQFWDCN